MKKIFDPVSNAKTIGFLLIISGIYGIVKYPSLLSQPNTQQSIIVPIFGIFSSIISLIIGFGLRSIKKWGLYGFLFLTGVNLLYMVWYLITNPKFSGLIVAFNIIFVIISIWLYQAKEKFRLN